MQDLELPEILDLPEKLLPCITEINKPYFCNVIPNNKHRTFAIKKVTQVP